MTARHKSKTTATLLAFLFGGLGLQRLYLRGWRDPWLWLHLAALPAAWLVATLAPQASRWPFHRTHRFLQPDGARRRSATAHHR